MKIRYLKTTEEFELIVPDPLNENATIQIRISDYDLFLVIQSKFSNQYDLDDDTFQGLKLLSKNYILSIRTLFLAKRQQHLRKLNRVASSWVELNRNERAPRQQSKENLERVEYLKENYEAIVNNCIKRDWFNEFCQLEKDLNPKISKDEIREKWKSLKNNVL